LKPAKSTRSATPVALFVLSVKISKRLFCLGSTGTYSLKNRAEGEFVNHDEINFSARNRLLFSWKTFSCQKRS
jgi:hypothetical protein